MLPTHNKPYLGFGLGLRTEYQPLFLTERPAVDWLEIITENYLIPGGNALQELDNLRQHYPMVMHGVSLSIGSTDPIDWDYLNEVKQLAKRIEPAWISDHLCWTGIHGKNTHDLLPLPYTEELIQHVVMRLCQIQDFLGQRLLIENVSSYITYQHSVMPEWEFITEILHRADCLMLLDVNNIYVSSVNHDFDPIQYITALPSSRIYQIHLAGHENNGDYLIDTHDHDIIDEVFALYQTTLRHHGLISTMIERDDNLPALSHVLNELQRARRIAEKIEEELTV